MTKKLYLIAIVLILLGAILFDTTNLEAIPTTLTFIGILMLIFAPITSFIINKHE